MCLSIYHSIYLIPSPYYEIQKPQSLDGWMAGRVGGWAAGRVAGWLGGWASSWPGSVYPLFYSLYSFLSIRLAN